MKSLVLTGCSVLLLLLLARSSHSLHCPTTRWTYDSSGNIEKCDSNPSCSSEITTASSASDQLCAILSKHNVNDKSQTFERGPINIDRATHQNLLIHVKQTNVFSPPVAGWRAKECVWQLLFAGMSERGVVLPSWDEFDPAAEELDYGDDDVMLADNQGQEEVDEAAPSCSSPFAVEEVEEPCSSSGPARTRRFPQVNSADQLPRVADNDTMPQRNIGPALPPGFALLGDDAAPEDPSDDPEDPGMAGSPRPIRILGPQLPQLPGPSTSRSVGPQLPTRIVGPSLPSSSSLRSNSVQIGPSIPSLPITRQVAGPSVPTPPQRNSIGPALPPTISDVMMAPSLPDDELRNHASNGFGDSAESSSSLPPPEPVGPRHSPAEDRVIGPAMPPDLLPMDRNGGEREDDEEEEDDEDVFGPMPPPPTDDMPRGASQQPEMPFDDDEDEVIGPMPPGDDNERAAEEYALRALALEQQREAEKNATKREEWMTQLPKKLANYGLGARTFNKGTAPGEKDETWMETPEQTRQRLARGDASLPSTSGQSNIQAEAVRLRDEQQQKVASEINHNRNESLFDSHLRKRKADTEQSNGSGEPSGRQGFDRDRDMDVRGLKKASAAELKERCGALSNRFGPSNNQKFL